MEGRYEFILLENGGLSKRLFGANQVSLRMFAIIEDGSHQYRVAPGETLVVDYRDTVSVGDSIQFEKVLLANDGGSSTIGRPLIEGASVSAEVIDSKLKGEKLEIQKFRFRSLGVLLLAVSTPASLTTKPLPSSRYFSLTMACC